MQERANGPLVAFILLLLLALIVLFGIQAKSVWVSLLVMGGVVAVFYSLGTARSRQSAGFWIGTILGLAALAAAVWLGHMAGRFWWTPLFLFLSLLFVSNGITLNSEYKRAAGSVAVMIAILLFIFAILGPWLLFGAISGSPQIAAAPAAPAAAPTVIPAPATPPVERGMFFPGIWDFLLVAVKSGWGILYLALAILLGRIWLGKWGWLIAPIALLLAVGGLAWSKPGGAEPLGFFFATPPLELVISTLTWSARQFGSAAWGALILGAGLVLVLFPAYLTMYAANRALVKAQQVRQALGTTFAANLLGASGQYTPYTSFVSLVTVAAIITGFILVWKALVSLSAATGTLPFSLLGVPDISLPRWKPIWQGSYFLNAGIYAFIGLVLSSIQRRLKLAAVNINWFLILVGAVLAGMFLPAGVVEFLAGQSLVLCLVTPLSLLKKVSMAAPPRPAPPVQREANFADLLRRMEAEAALQKAIQEASVEEDEEEEEYPVAPPPTPMRAEPPIIVGGKYSQEEGELVVEHVCEIVDMIPGSSGGFLYLDVFGEVWQGSVDGDESRLASFNLGHPLGLAAVSGGHVAAVDQSGRVFHSSAPSEAIPAAQPILAFTVNSFGTILAYASPGSTCVRGLILAAGKDQLFIDTGQRLTDLCFSRDNRYLGIGTIDGDVLVFDMASRKIIQTVATAQTQAVRHLCAGADGGWVAAYEDGEISHWDSEGDLMHSWGAEGKVTCLACDANSGYVAYGNNLGQVTILDVDFNSLQSAALHDQDVISVIFETSGNSLITAGLDGAIRKLEF